MASGNRARSEVPPGSGVPDMDMRISLRRLEVFCLVVEEGGVTRAAEHLFVAQPAVSGQIRALEEWIGTKLFARTGGRLVLTDAGHRVYEWAKETLARSLEMRRDVASLGDGTRGTIILAASPGAGTYLLPPPLIDLRLARPEVEVVINVSQPTDALHAAETGEADLAIVAWDQRDTPESLVGDHLHSEEIILCAAPDGPPDTDVLERSQVAGLPHVGISTRAAYHRMLELQLRRQGVRNRNIVLQLGHAETVKRALRDHQMVAFLSKYIVDDELAAGTLRQVRVENLKVEEHLWMFRRAGKPQTPLHEIAVDAIRDYLARRQPETT
jgi:DNA-binding transcriptional LysR family regulator